MHPYAKTAAGIIVTVVILPTVLGVIHVEPWIRHCQSKFYTGLFR